jgi:pimeloyl-ACP methyl ester carboxylesterase
LRPYIVPGRYPSLPRSLPEAVRDDYLASYQRDRFAESLRYLRSYPVDLPVLAGLLPQIETPVQIIADAGGTAVPPVHARFLSERLPHSKLDVIDTGHFNREDAAAEYAALVTSWWHGAAKGSKE